MNQTDVVTREKAVAAATPVMPHGMTNARLNTILRTICAILIFMESSGLPIPQDIYRAAPVKTLTAWHGIRMRMITTAASKPCPIHANMICRAIMKVNMNTKDWRLS